MWLATWTNKWGIRHRSLVLLVYTTNHHRYHYSLSFAKLEVSIRLYVTLLRIFSLDDKPLRDFFFFNNLGPWEFFIFLGLFYFIYSEFDKSRKLLWKLRIWWDLRMDLFNARKLRTSRVTGLMGRLLWPKKCLNACAEFYGPKLSL